MTNKVLIVNCQANGYGVLSSLCSESNSYYIIACDPLKRCASFKSRYVDRYEVIPTINNNEAAFIDFIINIGKEYNDKIFLIPTHDVYLNAFHHNWQKLEPYFIPVFETDPDIFLNCIEKKRMYEMAEKAGVPYPRSFYHSSEIDEKDIFPVIVKPLIKTANNFARIPFRIKKFENIVDLRVAEKLFHAESIDYVIQQFIPGEDDQLYTGGTVSIQGKIYGLGTGRKIRQYPPNLGVCAYGELIKDEKLELYTRKLIQYSRVTGISQVEFKKYKDEYYLMEINPRPWLWNRLITYGGVNLPKIFIEAYYDRAINESKQVKYEGHYSVSMKDLIYNVKNFKTISFFK